MKPEIPVLPRTDWRAYLASVHAQAYADAEGLEDLPYTRAERSFWQSAVMMALQSAEHAVVLSSIEDRLRDAQILALEARLEFLERALEAREKQSG